MKKLQKGFTLIELMIVVAIIGILAAVAIPSYQDYITKAKLSKVAGIVDSLKTAIALYHQEQGGFVNTAGVYNATGAGWSSLGITKPSMTTEVSRIDMTACLNDCSGLAVMASPRTTDLTGAATNMIRVQIDSVKKGSIDGATIIMRPNVNEGGTTMTWSNFCELGVALPGGSATATSIDPAVLKYFKIPGTACAVPF